MEKIFLKKNRLDMEYKFESQKAIVCLTFGTIALLGFLGSMLLQQYYLIAGIMGFIVLSFSFIFYKITKKKLDGILIKIENLK